VFVVVLAVKTAPFCLNLRNFETERDTSDKHGIKSLDLQDLYQYDPCCFVVSRFVPKLRRLKKNRSGQYFSGY